MSMKGFPDYIVGWVGVGTVTIVDLGYAPRSVTVCCEATGTTFTRIAGMSAAIELPAGVSSPDVDFTASGLRVTGKANLSGVSYSATVQA